MDNITLVILYIAWPLSGIIGWWVTVRYFLKKLQINDLVVIPVCLVMGPVFLVMAVAFTWDKTLKEWND